MEKTITLTVNGRLQTLTTDPARPLLEVLREELGLTGAKLGCGEGQCGACTVLVGSRAVASCITPVGEVEGRSIRTIEGLARGQTLHPVQQAFLEEKGFQCGYCTPGMILATVALMEAQADPTDAQIRARLEGHLCRCGGYPNVLRSVRRAVRAGGATP